MALKIYTYQRPYYFIKVIACKNRDNRMCCQILLEPATVRLALYKIKYILYKPIGSSLQS